MDPALASTVASAARHKKCVFGIETEYAFAVLRPDRVRLDQSTALERLFGLARQKLTWLPGRGSSGLFLSNGYRMYVDCQKPELATPECSTPDELVIWQRAGEAILLELAVELAQPSDVGEVLISNVNVSYAGNGSTWACHESYGHRAISGSPAPDLIPHLASRIIFTGGGGFDNKAPGLEFLISPRVAHLQCDISGESTNNRGIFHTKNESLAGPGFNRLHVLCGEGVCSDTALWLKVSTTALVVALVEAGKLSDGGGPTKRGVRLVSPLAAMRDFARDPSLAAQAEVERGHRMSALAIQKKLWEIARRNQSASFMPDWAPQACELWGQILGRLEEGPEAAAKKLDWAIKWNIYRRYAERRGLTWEKVVAWNKVLRELQTAWHRALPTGSATPVITKDVLTATTPAKPFLHVLRPLLVAQGLDWSDLEHFLQVRQELFAIDTRFGELKTGLFAMLDSEGALDHRVLQPGQTSKEFVRSIEHAKTHPPQTTRAKVRGETIARLALQHAHYACEWSVVYDLQRSRELPLHDPFQLQSEWRPPPPSPQAPHLMSDDYADQRHFDRDASRTADLPSYIDGALRAVLQLYDQGQFAMAQRRLAELELYRPTLTGPQLRDFLRYRAWVHSRLGGTQGAAELGTFLELNSPLQPLADYICALRHQGLAPPQSITVYLARGDQALRRAGTANAGTQAAYLDHKAYTLLREGRGPQARLEIEAALQPRLFGAAHPSVQARLLAEKAEACRMLGELDEARAALRAAEDLQAEHGFEADLADLTLTCGAKLALTDGVLAAKRHLRQAETIQRRLHLHQGLARTLLLRVRLPSSVWSVFRQRRCHQALQEVQRLQGALPALRNCWMLAKILNNFQSWTRGEMVEGETDFFWNL
jgi:proteasome accessory factor A